MKKLILFILIGLTLLGGYCLLNDESPELNKRLSLQDHSIYEGDLILINKEIQLQNDPSQLTNIPQSLAPNVLVNDTFQLQPQVIDSLQLMFHAAERKNVENFIINSAYRSGRLQQQLYEEKGSSYALPAGYSEHQSGLAIDIGSTKGTMDQSEEGRWLAKNAYRYGFILRYPENKEEITNINYEPWHFRYVGLPHSVKMEEQHLVLEEYIDYVKKQGHYSMKLNGTTYFVQYIAEASEALIPLTDDYTISGNNIDGYIITSTIMN